MNLITADTVAKTIGYASSDAFLANRGRLEKELSFPPPLPTCQRPLKWRAEAVTAWFNSQGGMIEQGFDDPANDTWLMRKARTA
ncbi:MAG: hypothetical protein AAFU41_00675 [Pseudomonadota bacterium]